MTIEDFDLNNLMSIRKELYAAAKLLDELADVCHCSDGGECLAMAKDAISQAQNRLTLLETELLDPGAGSRHDLVTRLVKVVTQ